MPTAYHHGESKGFYGKDMVQNNLQWFVLDKSIFDAYCFVANKALYVTYLKIQLSSVDMDGLNIIL